MSIGASEGFFKETLMYLTTFQ